MRPRAALGACLAVLLLAGCGSRSSGGGADAGLLTRFDMPDTPALVSGAARLPDAAPTWGCAGHEDRLLAARGWSHHARRFLYDGDNGRWAVYSVLFTRRSGGAGQMLPRLQAAVRRCITAGAHVQDLGIVPAAGSQGRRATFTWQSWGRAGFVEARRGYAVADGRHLVEITVVGLHGTLAPPVVGELLAAGSDRATRH